MILPKCRRVTTSSEAINSASKKVGIVWLNSTSWTWETHNMRENSVNWEKLLKLSELISVANPLATQRSYLARFLSCLTHKCWAERRLREAGHQWGLSCQAHLPWSTTFWVLNTSLESSLRPLLFSQKMFQCN